MKIRRDVFQAIADPTRRSILMLLASQTLTAGAIAENFNAARPTISKHIQILHECELIESNQKGREIFYQIKFEKVGEINEWLEQIKKIWETRFDQLDNLIQTINNKKNED